MAIITSYSATSALDYKVFASTQKNVVVDNPQLGHRLLSVSTNNF